MSDIKEALQLIIANAISSTRALETDFPITVLPGDMKILSLEKDQKVRNQFRGRLSTHAVMDFCHYANMQTAGACFIDREAMSATAYFDIGNTETPGHCKHSARITLKTTAAYRAMNEIDGQRLDQSGLAEFIEDWADNIKARTSLDEPDMGNKEAAAAVRDVTIKERSESAHNVQTFSTQKSVMEQLDATSKDKPLPGFIIFKCKPYIDLDDYEIMMRISMIISRQDQPAFTARSITLDAVKEKMSDEFIDLIDTKLTSNITNIVGSFDPGS